MPTTHPPAIQISRLSKSFKDNHVLRGIDLNIAPGIVFALLGANGAGKTTAINILTTLLSPDAGQQCATRAGTPVGYGNRCPVSDRPCGTGIDCVADTPDNPKEADPERDWIPTQIAPP